MLTSLAEACQSSTFSDLSLFGAKILSTDANLVTNYTATAPETLRLTQPSIEKHNISFCNVTVTYTHPGQDDKINVETWLPVDDWNGRMQAVGGGGYVAARFVVSYGNMNGAVADGYATITTDAGIGMDLDLEPWGLLSPGNVNLYNLQNFASVSLNDEAIIGKSLIKKLYGKDPDYSYWNGCSQGGRQGLMLAQRYPNAYDGIAAGAPAIYYPQLQPNIYWPQQFMNMDGDSVPHPCEINAIRAAAIKTCDGFDGVVDGIVAEPDACLENFNPFDMVGKTINCTGNKALDISPSAAAIINAIWQGPSTVDGRQSGFGFSVGADLTGSDPAFLGTPGPLGINCTSGTCVGQPNPQLMQWFQIFVAADPKLDVSSLSHSEYDQLVNLGIQRLDSIIGTSDPDLSVFKQSGGKMITYHGLSDNTIPSKGTENYYDSVKQILPDVHEFYRYFEAPGLGHCIGGPSGQPTHLFDQLRAWVENGTAPEQTSVKITDKSGGKQSRIWCAFPKKPYYEKACRDAANAKCWSCQG